jgi:hypothetical protein
MIWMVNEATVTELNTGTVDRVNQITNQKRLQKRTSAIFARLNGEGGIRTRGKVLPLRRFSKAVLSTTQPPLQPKKLALFQQHWS